MGNRRNGLRRLAYLAAVMAMAAWILAFWPRGLGGRAGYVMVRGTSMNPTYHTGDLILTHTRPEYRAGDIVAYRVPAGHAGAGIVVIHRITGGTAGDGYILQGDNNPRPDDWRPKPGDIVGRAWLHVPRAGSLLALLHDPLPLASLAAGTVIALLLVPADRRFRLGASSGKRPSGRASPDADLEGDDGRPGRGQCP